MNEKKNRKIEITLAGDAVQDSRISVSLFAKTIQSVQEIVFQVAGARLNRDMKGPVPTKIKQACELFLVKTEPGSFHAVLEFPEKEATLLVDEADFSEEVLEDTQKVIDAIVNADEAGLEQALPQPILRRRIMTRIQAIAPASGSDYCLSFRFNGGPPKALFRPRKEDYPRLAAMPPAFEKIAEPPLMFVEAKGMAQVENGDIKKWVETYEVSELDLDPDHVWRPQVIRAKGRLFRLAHPIACVIEKQADLFFSEDARFGIMAYGNTREEVMEDFSDHFAALWDAIVQEEESLLTKDALILRNSLLKLVRKVEPHGDAEDAGNQGSSD